MPAGIKSSALPSRAISGVSKKRSTATIAIIPRQSKSEALAKVERMQEAIIGTRFLEKEKISAHLTASFGLACFPHDASDKGALLAEADRCLFQSKADGKNRITVET